MVTTKEPGLSVNRTDCDSDLFYSHLNDQLHIDAPFIHRLRQSLRFRASIPYSSPLTKIKDRKKLSTDYADYAESANLAWSNEQHTFAAAEYTGHTAGHQR